jgi:hypothetical protein
MGVEIGSKPIKIYWPLFALMDNKLTIVRLLHLSYLMGFMLGATLII